MRSARWHWRPARDARTSSTCVTRGWNEYALPVLRAGAMFDGGVLLVRELAAGLVLASLADVAGMESTPWVAVGTAATEVEHAFRQTELIDGLRPAGDLTLLSPLAMVYEEPPPAVTIEVHDSVLGRCARSTQPIADEAARATFRATRAADTAPDRAAHIDLLFERGVPVALNGVRMPMAELVDSVDTIAGGQGVGRFTGVLAPLSTSRHAVHCRGEAPALTILSHAYDALASHTLPSDLVSLRDDGAARLRRVIREGRWFTPTRLALLAIMDATSAPMHGVVTTRLFKGDPRSRA